MTLSCNCDMPIEVYADWLQDQGWDTDELREMEDVILVYCNYGTGSGMGYSFGMGQGHGYEDQYPTRVAYGYGYGYEYDPMTANGDGLRRPSGNGPSVYGVAHDPFL